MKLRCGKSLAIAAAVSLAGAAWGDIPVPTTVAFYFTRDGKPHTKPVDFSVRCYGWARYPGEPGFKGPDGGERPEPYKPVEVYDYSGSCPTYGCTIHHGLHLNYRHIEYCDVEGKTEGRSFRIEKIGTSPVGACSDVAGSDRPRFLRTCELRLAIPK